MTSKKSPKWVHFCAKRIRFLRSGLNQPPHQPVGIYPFWSKWVKFTSPEAQKRDIFGPKMAIFGDFRFHKSEIRVRFAQKC